MSQYFPFFRIAVVIPAYGREEPLLRSIQSVAAQTRQPDEVIVVDDGSSDSLERAQSLVCELGYRWVRLEENQGPAAARNRGVDEAEADWVAFLDSDDEWMPEKLAAQERWHRSHPESLISQVQEEWVRDGAVVNKPLHWEQRGGDLFSASVERCSIGPSCVMMARAFLQRLGGFDPVFRVCEDYELWLRVTQEVEVGLASEEPLVRKIAGHEGQLSVTTPAMDRFRIHALLKCLKAGVEDENRRQEMVSGLVRKAKVLAKGAVKRGLDERTELYEALAGVDWNRAREKTVSDWLARSAAECSMGELN